MLSSRVKEEAGTVGVEGEVDEPEGLVGAADDPLIAKTAITRITTTTAPAMRIGFIFGKEVHDVRKNLKK